MTRNQRRKKSYYTNAEISIYASIAIELHKQHRWGKKRITKLLAGSKMQVESVKNNIVMIKDLLKICEGLKVKIK